MHYKGTLLAKLKVDDGDWGWGEAFTHQKVMRFWGIKPPSVFYNYSKEDQVYMMVAYEEEMKMLAFQQQIDRVKQESESLKASGSSEG